MKNYIAVGMLKLSETFIGLGLGLLLFYESLTPTEGALPLDRDDLQCIS